MSARPAATSLMPLVAPPRLSKMFLPVFFVYCCRFDHKGLLGDTAARPLQICFFGKAGDSKKPATIIISAALYKTVFAIMINLIILFFHA